MKKYLNITQLQKNTGEQLTTLQVSKLRKLIINHEGINKAIFQFLPSVPYRTLKSFDMTRFTALNFLNRWGGQYDPKFFRMLGAQWDINSLLSVQDTYIEPL